VAVKEKKVFVPHEACTVASGDCFTQARCLRQCRQRQKADVESRIALLERQVKALEAAQKKYNITP
jgi:hypothetical protein